MGIAGQEACHERSDAIRDAGPGDDVRSRWGGCFPLAVASGHFSADAAGDGAAFSVAHGTGKWDKGTGAGIRATQVTGERTEAKNAGWDLCYRVIERVSLAQR